MCWAGILHRWIKLGQSQSLLKLWICQRRPGGEWWHLIEVGKLRTRSLQTCPLDFPLARLRQVLLAEASALPSITRSLNLPPHILHRLLDVALDFVSLAYGQAILSWSELFNTCLWAERLARRVGLFSWKSFVLAVAKDWRGTWGEGSICWWELAT